MNASESHIMNICTVLLLTYNHARFIEQCINSILDQKTSFKFNTIIGEDYSTDGTREKVIEYKTKYPDRIQLILNDCNKGPHESYLNLLSQAKTKYVLITDGDDYFTDNTKLQKQVDFLENHPLYSACFHYVTMTWEDNSKPDSVFPPVHLMPKTLIEENYLSLKDELIENLMQTNAVMYRWRFLEENIRDFIPSNILPCDWFLHMLHAEKNNVGFLPENMAVYRRHINGIWFDVWSDEKIRRYGPWLINFYKTVYLHFQGYPQAQHFLGKYFYLQKKYKLLTK